MSSIVCVNREMCEMHDEMRMCMCMLDVRRYHLHPFDAND